MKSADNYVDTHRYATREDVATNVTMYENIKR